MWKYSNRIKRDRSIDRSAFSFTTSNHQNNLDSQSFLIDSFNYESGPTANRYDSNESLDRSSSSENESPSLHLKRSLPKKLKSFKSPSKHLPAKFKKVSTKKFLSNKFLNDAVKLRKSDKEAIDAKKSPKLFKAIKNKLRSFSSKVTDKTIEQSKDSIKKVLFKNSDNYQELNGNLNEVNFKKSKNKLFANLIGKLTSSNLVQTLKATKDDELIRIQLTKKKVKYALNNLHHNLIHLIAGKSHKQ